MEIPMTFYLVVSTVMFFAGVYGFIARKNMLAILISLELMLNSVDLNFVVFNRYLYPEALEGFYIGSRNCYRYRYYHQYIPKHQKYPSQQSG